MESTAQRNASRSRKRLLMCNPDHFQVDYVINPWMEQQVGRTNHSLATRQWRAFHDFLSSVAAIELIAPQAGLPDMVFTANAGLVIDETVVVSRFRSTERRGEEPLFKLWFERHGLAIAPWPDDICFEGAGDALLDRARPLLWCGYGFRTDAGAPALLENVFGRKTAPLRLVDPRFYHLDTCFCPLSGGYLMYYAPAFDAASLERIAAIVEPEKRIEVGPEDALHFACNAVELGRRIFMNNASGLLQSRLRARGFEPTICPLPEFIHAGGAAKCLTLELGDA
jgi:N-dimethylarginine dimethylaminohydrolase